MPNCRMIYYGLNRLVFKLPKQKNLFGKSFKLIDYKNCDVDKEWCSANGISRYPTWKLPDGNKRQGTQELYSLQQASSNCSL